LYRITQKRGGWISMKMIEDVIDDLFKNFIEEAIQNIEIGSLITSRESVQKVLKALHIETQNALNLEPNKLLEYFSKIGFEIYKTYRIPAFFWINMLEKIKEDLLYAIHHKIIQYNDDVLLLRLDKLTQGLCKGYLQASAQDTLRFSYDKINAINIEMDIMAHERWYKSFLEYLSDENNPVPELLYEKSESHMWLNSLDFKLLMKSCSFEKESEIVIFMRKAYDLSREIKYYIDKEQYKNAYNCFVALDRKLNLLSDMLKEVLINFMSDKLHLFFGLFSEIILFQKQYSYFLTLSVSISNEAVHKRDIHRLFLKLFQMTKKKAKELTYQFTGVVDDGDAMHFLVRYKEQDDVKKIFDFVTESITELKEKEITLSVPNFIVRASETEVFSGLDAPTLRKVAFNMAKEYVHIPNYHFNQKECEILRSNAENESIVSGKIKQAIEEKKIQLAFQPIVSVNKTARSLAYCEVLSRMEDNGELVDAEEFIHTVIAQKMTSALDILVYERLKRLSKSIAELMQGVSVNIFPDSFKDGAVLKALKECLQSFAKEEITLTLEITEYNLFEHYEILQVLKAEYTDTLNIAVDDFGSGYSSLAALIKLSKHNLLDAVKIDGTLTREVVTDETSYAIVKTALVLSKKLKAKIIIEYVENEDIEKKLLQGINTFYGQGYLYGKAMPLEEIKNSF